MPLDTTQYLQRFGWSSGAGLGKHSTGTTHALKPRTKQNTHGVGAEQTIDTFNNELGRYANIFNKSMQNINIVIPDSSSSDSDSDTNSHQHRRKRQKSGDDDSSGAVVGMGVMTAASKKHFIKLGFGLNALGFAANTSIQQAEVAQLYLGLFQRSTHAPLNSDVSNGDNVVSQQHTRQYGVSQNDNVHRQQNDEESATQRSLMQRLTAGWSTVQTEHGASAAVDSTVSVFDGNRQHMYHDRMPGKLRRLYMQDLKAQALVSNGGVPAAAQQTLVSTTTTTTTTSTVVPAELNGAIKVLHDDDQTTRKSKKHKHKSSKRDKLNKSSKKKKKRRKSKD